MKTKNILIMAFTLTFLSSCAGLFRAKKEYINEMHYNFSDNIYLSFGWGGNSGLIEFEDFIVIIDTKTEKKANFFYESIKHKLKTKKLYIINTHGHHDHTSGNFLYQADSIFIPDYTDSLWNFFNNENNRINKLPYVKVKKEILLKDSHNTLKIIPAGNCHTRQDLIVYLPNEKLLFTGDLFFNRYHPYFEKESHSNAKSWMHKLYHILNNYDIDKVVPGHGPISDKAGLNEQAEYLKDIIETLKKKEDLRKIKKKYKHFDNLPGKTSLKKTIKFIETN